MVTIEQLRELEGREVTVGRNYNGEIREYTGILKLVTSCYIILVQDDRNEVMVHKPYKKDVADDKRRTHPYYILVTSSDHAIRYVEYVLLEEVETTYELW